MAYNNIILSANSSSPLEEGPASDEEAVGEIVWPGSLCDIKRGLVLAVLTDNSIHTCGQPGGTISPVIIALEDIENGKTVNDRYYPGERVPVRHLRPGDVFLCRFDPVGAYDQGTKLKATGPVALGTFNTTTQWSSAMAYAHEPIEAGASGRLVVAAVK